MKDNQKQHLIDMMKSDEELGLYETKQFLASTIVNGNEVQLIKELGWYYINWGDSTQVGKTRTRIETPKGRKPSFNQVHKQFLEACKAAEYLKFSKP